MDILDFKKLVKHFKEENITSDEPHVSLRCEENNIFLENVKQTILDQNAKLIRIIPDRSKVYKIYYRISRKRELKIIIDMFGYNKLNIRTVKILSDKFKIGNIPKQRF